MKHVAKRKAGCKPDKSAKSGAEVIDLEGDDFKKSRGFREPCLARRKSGAFHRRQRGSKVGHVNRTGIGGTPPDKKGPQTNKEAIGVEFCPICQCPFRNLVGQSAEWHVDDCLASHGSISNLG